MPMPALTHPHPHPHPHALRLDLLPDPIARTGTPLSRSSSPAPTGVHTPRSPSHPNPSPTRDGHPTIYHPAPQLYPAHSTVLPPMPTFLHASNAQSASSRISQQQQQQSSSTTSPSPPTTPTPTPFKLDGRTSDEQQVEVGLREMEDREGVHHQSGDRQAVDGLEHDKGWIEAKEVLDVKGGTKVRGISVDDYAKLEQHHLSLDVPETTLFPWLHGMGDGNKLLDEFFASFPGYQAQFPAPRYRGLTVLQASGPGDSRPPSAESGDGGWDVGRRRGGSLASDFSSQESDLSWNHSEAGSFPTSISSFASSLSTSSSCPARDPPSPINHTTPHPIPSADSSAGQSSMGVDASTGSVGLNPSPLRAYTPPPLSSSPARTSIRSVLTSAVPAEEILTLTPHASRRVGESTAAGRHPLDDRTSGEELAKVPLGRKGAVRGVFRRRDVGEGTISLRNLGVQGKKYATISDIVVYHPQGFCTSALNVAERCAEAVEAVYEERKAAIRACRQDDGVEVEPVRYNVFLVTEPFEAFEDRHPELVAIDHDGRVRNKIDLFEKERKENSELTRAREVSPGFWMGNSFDCPVLSGVNSEVADGGGSSKGNNTLGVDVCIEAFDDAEMPDAHRLRHAAEYLDSIALSKRQEDELARHLSSATASLALQSPPLNGKPFFFPRSLPDQRPFTRDQEKRAERIASGWLTPPEEIMSDPDLAESEQARVDAGQIYHLQCTSTSLVVPPGDWRGMNALASQIVDFVKWTKQMVDLGRRVLVHGYDGYTETSIFALSYMMHAHSLGLPDAYLHLHLISGRSFFVYPHDLPLLRRIDDRLEKDARAATASSTVQAQHASTPSTYSLPPTTGPKWKSMLGGWKLGHSTEPSSPTSPTAPSIGATKAEKERREQEQRAAEKRRKHDGWFDSPCFEGSLPSRILDFIYLGNLNHASNPSMLHMLGITHVVSVGESALLDPKAPDGSIQPYPNLVFGGGGSGSPNYELWNEHQAGRIKVLDMQSICDDGVSPLRPCIALAVEWMERARREGGKVLIHCKVGVSRSATVTIAYLMKHCGYTLIDAYMLVRARRLNVLIQPNLKFMFELQGWEVELSREKAELEHGVHMKVNAHGEAVAEGPRQHGTKAMSWPVMAKEMAILNHRYLGGSVA